jgi:hypothetical protein
MLSFITLYLAPLFLYIGINGATSSMTKEIKLVPSPSILYNPSGLKKEEFV